MGVLILIACYLLVRYLMKTARRRTEEKRKAEQDRLQEEFRRQQAESKRIVAEQIRQAKEQERQARELAKHEEWLKKHDLKIAKLEQQIGLAESEIAFNREQRERLFKLLDIAEKEQSSYTPDCDTWQKFQKKIIALNNQIYSAQKKIDKAQITKLNAERQLDIA